MRCNSLQITSGFGQNARNNFHDDGDHNNDDENDDKDGDDDDDDDRWKYGSLQQGKLHWPSNCLFAVPSQTALP